MADYKELLRRAISALPENNGAARRAVYEKARSALVGQLRAIQPPLPAREITQHRLQLEDCIRQVEQEASEAVINLGRDAAQAQRPIFTPRPPVETPKTAEPAAPVAEASEPEAETEPEPDFVEPEPLPPEPEAEPAIEPEPQIAEPVAPPPPAPEPVRTEPVATKSIEDIIAEAAATSGASVAPAVRPMPFGNDAGVPALDAATIQPAPATKPFFFARRPAATPVAETGAAAAFAPVLEPTLGSTALASQPASEPVIIDPPLPVDTALSAVREVEVEDREAREAEGAIERAIETLDREARGETTEPLSETAAGAARNDAPLGGDRNEEGGFAPAGAETRSGAGLTIFLVVFAVLLVGVGGAGFWAWREEYIDLDQMFGQATPAVTETAQNETTTPSMGQPNGNGTTGDEGGAGPGNTATTSATEPTAALEGGEDRLEPTPEPVTPTGNETVLPSIGANAQDKTEERLSEQDTSIATNNDAAASVDPLNLAGNQSLLLEASGGGQGGAVPFSGTVEWTEGVDEIGAPTLIADASIPARNLSVEIVIRKNNDPILPASHLMEVTFDVPDTFIGGSIASLAGVLLKNEELVPGTALSGAAARVVGNSFLFALSASPDDVTSNTNLLETRRWLDLAVVYGTGRNAILTLEKDEDAQGLFDRVLAAWDE